MGLRTRRTEFLSQFKTKKNHLVSQAIEFSNTSTPKFSMSEKSLFFLYFPKKFKEIDYEHSKYELNS